MSRITRGHLMGSAALGLALIEMALPNAARAQTAALARTSATVEELIVTAERREVSLQNVPIAVTALTAQTVEASGVTRTDELFKLTPALTQTHSSRSNVTYLRGVGTASASLGEESEISTYVDGVYIGSPQGGVFDLNNIERIEVLKGPQGTLFGRNSTGGLIQVITRNPTDHPELKVGVGYGNFNTLSGHFYAATGVLPGLAADLAISFSHQGDGFGRNANTGDPVGITRDFNIRTKEVWTVNDRVKAILALDYQRLRSDYGNWRQVYPGDTAFLGVTYNGSFYDTPAGKGTTPYGNKLPGAEQYGGSVTVDADLGAATLTNITAVRRYHAFGEYDNDGGPTPAADVWSDEWTTTIQQEDFLQGKIGNLSWTAGGIYMYINAEYKPLGTVSQVLIPVINFNRFNTQTTNSYAGYVQGTYALTPSTDLTLGARYTFDYRQLVGTNIAIAGFPGIPAGAPIPAACPIDGAPKNPATGLPPTVTQNTCNQSKHWGAPSWRAAVDQHLGGDAMVYASVSRGFKSGVFNPTANNAPPVNPETLTAYEAGVKLYAFDRMLRFNVEAFHYDYKNIQLTVPSVGSGTSTFLFNAAAGKLNGADFDVGFNPHLPVGDLALNLAWSFLDTKYTSFPTNICTSRRLVAPFGNKAAVCSGNGLKMLRAPDESGTFAADYSVPFGGGTVTFHGDLYHSGKFYWTSDNRLTQPPYTILNGRIVFQTASKRWKMSLWGKNLADKKYFAEVKEDTSFGDFFTPAPPRMFGITLDYAM